MYIIQAQLFDFEAFIAKKENDRLVMVLEALPAGGLISALEKERWTGRKGYSVRGMCSALIAGILRQALYYWLMWCGCWNGTKMPGWSSGVGTVTT